VEISPSIVTNLTTPLPSSAANIIPWEVTPLSGRGFRLATKTTDLPVNSSIE
jgi:hypothetical protein